jgi:hypothetical protein
MPILLKNINAEVLYIPSGEIKLATNIIAESQISDYINIHGFIAFLQNYKNVYNLEYLQSPLRHGLKNQYNLETTILEINY